MDKIFENWNKFINEKREIKLFSTQLTIALKKPEGAAAVIDDTLTLIRAVPGVTVVNSETNKARSSVGKAIINLEFKFVPQSVSMNAELEKLKHDIFKVSDLILSVSPIARLRTTLKRVR